MKTAIIYASKHGTTEEIAKRISDELSANQHVTLINLKNEPVPDVADFDRIILGTAIYAGQPMRLMYKFAKKHADALTAKPLHLFIGGMEPNAEKQRAEMENAFPEPLRQHAGGVYFLGGAFRFEKMNFPERMIIKKIAKTDKNVADIKDENIARFIGELTADAR